MRHVDDFISDPASDKYAAEWFNKFRRPALTKLKDQDDSKLFASFGGQRFRVTGCSRLGDVWLHRDFTEDTSYEMRVDVDLLSDWSSKP